MGCVENNDDSEKEEKNRKSERNEKQIEHKTNPQNRLMEQNDGDNTVPLCTNETVKTVTWADVARMNTMPNK